MLSGKIVVSFDCEKKKKKKTSLTFAHYLFTIEFCVKIESFPIFNSLDLKLLTKKKNVWEIKF